MFTAYADGGYGCKQLAKALSGSSEERAREIRARYFDDRCYPPPNGGKAWSPSTIRDLLHNRRFLREFAYGRAENFVDADDAEHEFKRRRQADNSKISNVTLEDLRIIDDALWSRAKATGRRPG
jgi:hypothetical protein